MTHTHTHTHAHTRIHIQTPHTPAAGPDTHTCTENTDRQAHTHTPAAGPDTHTCTENTQTGTHTPAAGPDTHTCTKNTDRHTHTHTHTHTCSRPRHTHRHRKHRQTGTHAHLQQAQTHTHLHRKHRQTGTHAHTHTCSRRVSLESLYGTCLWLSTMALMTLPNDSSPRLMWMPSCKHIWGGVHTADQYSASLRSMCRVGQNHTFVGVYGVQTVFLAGKSPYIHTYGHIRCRYTVLANPIDVGGLQCSCGAQQQLTLMACKHKGSMPGVDRHTHTHTLYPPVFCGASSEDMLSVEQLYDS